MHTGTSPPIALTKYKTILRLLVRDFIPIRYRKCIRKDDDPWRVPEGEKDYIWDIKIPEYFTFPTEYDKELVKKKAKEIMGTCFKNFKGTLYKNFVLQNKEPDSMVDSLASRRTSGRISRNIGYLRST